MKMASCSYASQIPDMISFLMYGLHKCDIFISMCVYILFDIVIKNVKIIKFREPNKMVSKEVYVALYSR